MPYFTGTMLQYSRNLIAYHFAPRLETIMITYIHS